MKRFIALLLSVFLLAGCSQAPLIMPELWETPEPTSSPAEKTPLAAEPTPSPAPTSTPESTPTPTPAPTPTPEPTPTPHPWAAFFSEMELVRIKDGVSWQYSSPDFGVIIQKSYVEACQSLCYIAHVYDRTPEDYADGVLSDEAGMYQRVKPEVIARSFKAVVGITGTYFTYWHNGTNGPDIRNGIFWRDHMGEQCMVMLKDGTLSMLRNGRDPYTLADFQAQGIEHAYSFGPILVENGQPCEDIASHRLSYRNPRSAVGMVEPGHYVLIMVEGRKPGVSKGCTFNELAQLFIDEGCVNAYNLDGGQSAAIVFMGQMLNDHVGEEDTGIRPLIDMVIFGTSSLVPDVEKNP